MTTKISIFTLFLITALALAVAQEPAAPNTAPAVTPPSAQSAPAPAPAKQPDRAVAYYHFQLGHMYEEQAGLSGRMEFATRAIDEYHKALEADPQSAFLNSALAELYARTGRIKDAVQEAQESIQRDPGNLDARRLLGRIYLRSLGDIQSGDPHSQELLRLAIEQYEQIVKLDPSSLEDHLLLGRLYITSKDTLKAEGEFRAAVKLQPSAEDAVTLLAYLYNETGDSTRALAVLEAVPEKDRTAKINSALGYTYEQKKDYKNAIAAYRKAVDADKDNMDSVRGLAENLLNDNQVDAALALYKTVSESDPQDAQSLQRIAEIYRRDGKFDQALDALKNAGRLAPDSLEVPFNTASVYEAMGRYDDAIQVLSDLLKRTEKDEKDGSPSERNNRSIFLEHLGSIYRQQQKTKEAIETFRRMISLGDESGVRAYREIVETYSEVRQWVDVSQTLHEAVEKYPTDRRLQMDVAANDAENGKPDEAIARVKAMLNGSMDNDREVWVTLAQINLRLKRWSDAEEAVARAIGLSPTAEDKELAGYLEGSIYERQKKYDKAEESFRRVITDDPRNAGALNYLGYMLADRGVRLDDALGYIRRAVALEPQNGAYLDSLGWVYYKMGRYDLAEENLRKALESSSDPTILDHMADLYQHTGRLKLAVTHWERALEEWKRSMPADVDPADVAKAQKKLESARTKLAREERTGRE